MNVINFMSTVEVLVDFGLPIFLKLVITTKNSTQWIKLRKFDQRY